MFGIVIISIMSYLSLIIMFLPIILAITLQIKKPLQKYDSIGNGLLIGCIIVFGYGLLFFLIMLIRILSNSYLGEEELGPLTILFYLGIFSILYLIAGLIMKLVAKIKAKNIKDSSKIK
jgi:hypothetical protein